MFLAKLQLNLLGAISKFKKKKIKDHQNEDASAKT